MFRLALLAILAAPAAWADYVRVEAQGSVAEVADRLASAVEGAGATVFARVDHGAGAASVDMPVPDSVLLIFGNPQLGTPAISADPRAGLVLPLRVLVHDDDGQTVMVYEEVAEMFDEMDIDDDAAFVGAMEGALENLTGAAASP
mgnify:FL=1